MQWVRCDDILSVAPRNRSCPTPFAWSPSCLQCLLDFVGRYFRFCTSTGNDYGAPRPIGPPTKRVDHGRDCPDRNADGATITVMLVATVVSMWVLSAMAVTVRHGRSRMARWAQQQHNDQQPSPVVEVATMIAATAGGRLHDPGGGLSRANQLLRIVESQQQLGGNCTAGTDLNMGEGVVDRYAQVCSLLPLSLTRQFFTKTTDSVTHKRYFFSYGYVKRIFNLQHMTLLIIYSI